MKALYNLKQVQVAGRSNREISIVDEGQSISVEVNGVKGPSRKKSGDLVADLLHLQALSPEIFHLEGNWTNEICATENVEKLLPYLLAIVYSEGRDLLDERDFDENHSWYDDLKILESFRDGDSVNRLVRVNGATWVAWSGNKVLPFRIPEDYLEETWVSIRFCEAGAWNPETDYAAFGKLNDRLVMSCMAVPESGFTYDLALLTEPINQTANWLERNSYLEAWEKLEIAGNGSLVNAAVALLANNETSGIFPDLGYFQTETVLVTSENAEGLMNDENDLETVLDSNSSAEWRISIVDARNKFGKALLEELSSRHPGLPVSDPIYEFDDPDNLLNRGSEFNGQSAEAGSEFDKRANIAAPTETVEPPSRMLTDELLSQKLLSIAGSAERSFLNAKLQNDWIKTALEKMGAKDDPRLSWILGSVSASDQESLAKVLRQVAPTNFERRGRE